MEKIIYTTHFGSRLFGTSTPQSDTDIKHIVLPDIQSLLVGKRIANRVEKTNEAMNLKNGPEDVDIEFIPIQSLARDFYKGQAYALEIAFSIRGSHAGQTHYGPGGEPAPMDPHSDFCQFITELSERFLTSNINAMMGYVVSQASLYSFKGERLNAARAAKNLLRQAPPGETLLAMMGLPTFAQTARDVAADHPKYFSIGSYEAGSDRSAPCFKLLDKTLPWTIKVSTADEIVSSSIKSYGDRAQAASADNVDWKATMHAVRIVDEGISLLETGCIELPHPPERAARLLSIRRGEVPLDEIRDELDAKLDWLKGLSAESSLPPRSPELALVFDQWLEGWMMRLYGFTEKPTPLVRASLGP